MEVIIFFIYILGDFLKFSDSKSGNNDNDLT